MHASGVAPPHGPPPEFVGWIFGVVGLALFAVLIGIALLKLLVARSLKQRRRRTLCMVVAVLCCLGVPYGTLLGAATIIVLTRASVMRRFSGPPASGSGQAPAAAGG